MTLKKIFLDVFGQGKLYKKYFEITEDLLREHQQYKDRIKKTSLDDISVIDDLDYFTEERFNQTRKKILDAGNDATREIDKTLEFVSRSNPRSRYYDVRIDHKGNGKYVVIDETDFWRRGVMKKLPVLGSLSIVALTGIILALILK